MGSIFTSQKDLNGHFVPELVARHEFDVINFTIGSLCSSPAVSRNLCSATESFESGIVSTESIGNTK